MIDVVLEKLERLELDLNTIDPRKDVRAADRVADIARRLRQTMQTGAPVEGRLSRRLTQLRDIEALAG